MIKIKSLLENLPEAVLDRNPIYLFHEAKLVALIFPCKVKHWHPEWYLGTDERAKKTVSLTLEIE